MKLKRLIKSIFLILIKFNKKKERNFLKYLNKVKKIKMVKAPVKVVVRTRPTAQFAYKNIKIDENSNNISINIPKD